MPHCRNAEQEQPFHPDERLIGPKDVAALTGMTVRWVHETFSIPAKGGIPPIKLGNRSRWPYWKVRAWLDDRERESEVCS